MSRKPDGHEFFDLRHRATIPKGKCVYVQSGDPSDFDGYFIGTAGAVLSQHTANLDYVLVIPERRACSDRAETDTNKHVSAFSEQVLSTAGRLFRRLCPTSIVVRGPLNTRNIIPLKFMFSEPEKYGPLLDSQKLEPIRWRSVSDLAALINDDACASVVMDMNGSIGYLDKLIGLCPRLGPKLKAAGVPITIMAGILAEAETTTLRVPGRDPRSTMNAIYSSHAVHTLLELASTSGVPVQFVTNNTCNQMLRFEDAHEIVDEFDLSGLLKDLALVWYGPHLKGKCVPFDWVSFVAMLLHARYPELATVQRLQLWVGVNDPSVLVLRDPALPRSEVARVNMLDTTLWGEVECVVSVDKQAMLHLARFVSAQAVEMAAAAADEAAEAAAAAAAAPAAASPPAAASSPPLRTSVAGSKAAPRGVGVAPNSPSRGGAAPSSPVRAGPARTSLVAPNSPSQKSGGSPVKSAAVPAAAAARLSKPMLTHTASGRMSSTAAAAAAAKVGGSK